MSIVKVEITNNQIQKFDSGEYVDAKLVSQNGYKEVVLELKKESFEKYVEMRAAGELKEKNRLVKVKGVNGEKIAIFHNNPYYNFLSKEDRKELLRADIIICCYSVFLELELRRKAAVLSLFETHTQAQCINGKYLMKVFTGREGKLPAEMLNGDNYLEGHDLLDAIRKVSAVRCTRSMSNLFLCINSENCVYRINYI